MLRRIVLALSLLLAGSPVGATQTTLVTPGPPLPMTSLATFLNNAFLTLGGCFSGASAPAAAPSPITYQCWMDTTTNPSVLKIYDGASWITVASINTSTHTYTLAVDGAVITPTAASTLQALSITQTSPASGTTTGPFNFNSLNITNQYGATAATFTRGAPDNFISGIRADYFTGGTVSGFQTAGYFAANWTLGNGSMQSAAGVTGVGYANIANSNTGAAIIGVEGYTIVDTSGNVGGAFGVLAEIGIRTGGAALTRVGLGINNLGAVQGSVLDAAISVSNTTGWNGSSSAGAFQNLVYLTNNAGAFPLSTTAKFFVSDTTATVDSFLYAPNLTFNGYILNTPNATLTGAGVLTLTENTNAFTVLASITNSNAGTGAGTGFNASNGTNGVLFGVGGVNYTTIALLQARGFVRTSASPLVIDAGGANPVIFGVNDAEVGRFTPSGGLALGLTTDTPIGILNVLTGVRVNGAATSGNVLRGNGTNFISAALATTDLTGLGTNVATALAVNVGSAGAFVTFNGALGTPSSGTLTNATGLPTTGLTGTLQAAQEPAHTGDVTNSAGSLALSITNNAVTLAKLATQATNTVLGNATSGSGVPTALAVGSCDTSTKALQWTTNTGFACNSSINAATLGGATFSAPGAIGGGAPSTGAFTTLTASTSLTSPVHIGGAGTTGTQQAFQASTGNCTTCAFVWNLGNNGATTAMTLNNVGLNVGPAVAANYLFTVNANTVTPPTISGGSPIIQFVGPDSVSPVMTMDAFVGTVGTRSPFYTLRSARGNGGAFTASQSGDFLGFFGAVGANANNTFGATTGGGGGAFFGIVASETWGATAGGAEIRFYTTPNTTQALAIAGRFQNSGGLSIGTATDPGIGSLQLNAQAFMPNMASDTATADSTVCTATTGGKLLKGTGTLGICLGTSGRQFKTDFAPMAAGLTELMQIGFTNYRYRVGHGDNGVRMQYGTTAQDVDRVLPDLVGHDATGTAINYDSGALLFIGLRAIQELKVANDNLRAANDNLAARLAKVEAVRQ